MHTRTHTACLIRLTLLPTGVGERLKGLVFIVWACSKTMKICIAHQRTEVWWHIQKKWHPVISVNRFPANHFHGWGRLNHLLQVNKTDRILREVIILASRDTPHPGLSNPLWRRGPQNSLTYIIKLYSIYKKWIYANKKCFFGFDRNTVCPENHSRLSWCSNMETKRWNEA